MGGGEGEEAKLKAIGCVEEGKERGIMKGNVTTDMKDGERYLAGYLGGKAKGKVKYKEKRE